MGKGRSFGSDTHVQFDADTCQAGLATGGRFGFLGGETGESSRSWAIQPGMRD